MMQKITSLLKSRQFWTIVVMFVVNGFEGVKELVPASILPAINTLLGIFAVYFRVSPKQQF